MLGSVELLDRLTVPRLRGSDPPATVELLQGDLSAIPPEHAVDALVVSAFPNSYEPYPGTLFEDLFERGLDMREVAHHKQEDQRSHLGCWISETLPPGLAERFNVHRIVCFEPRSRSFLERSRLDVRSLEESV